MSQDEVIQIRVGNSPVGVIGLKNVLEDMAETGIMADIEHIRDIKEIGRYGVMGTPAVVVDGEVKCVGKIPSKEEVKAWIRA